MKTEEQNGGIAGWDIELEDWLDAPALRHIDRALCGEVRIIIDDEGDFLMNWTERHPELGELEDFFGDEERTQDRVGSVEWLDMLKRLPSSEHEVELARTEAYELFVRALLPSELHRDAGLD